MGYSLLTDYGDWISDVTFFDLKTMREHADKLQLPTAIKFFKQGRVSAKEMDDLLDDLEGSGDVGLMNLAETPSAASLMIRV